MTDSNSIPNFPPVIDTDRLILRLPTNNDVVELHAAFVETFDDLNEWFVRNETMPTLDDTAALIIRLNSCSRTGTEYPSRAFLKNESTYVGAVNLYIADPLGPNWEIGYWCRKSLQNQGYMSEAVRAVTKVGFNTLNANIMQITCDPNNLRSVRVAERSGYRLKTILLNHKLKPNGDIHDSAIYVCLPGDFDSNY